MALIECPECKKQISDQAAACPSCGARPPKEPKSYAWLWTILILLGGFLLYGGIKSNDPAVAAMRQDRNAYEYCLKVANDNPGNRVATGTCEQMRTDFIAKYNRAP